jgi:hypothetical protein
MCDMGTLGDAVSGCTTGKIKRILKRASITKSVGVVTNTEIEGGRHQTPEQRVSPARGSAESPPAPGCLRMTRSIQQRSSSDAPFQRSGGGFVVWASQDCTATFRLSWSHLWSHSCKFSGVRSGLPSLGSGVAEPNRTCLNHQPQNSKAREGKPSAGSNPAATASPNEKCQTHPAVNV